MAAAIGDDYFDGDDSPERVARHLRTARSAGVKFLRCAFSWNGIEPEPGKYRWEFWDDLVKQGAQNGITLIPYVAYTPRWAARTNVEFWKQPPSDPKLYSDFMYTIAQRYRGRVGSWELWNEPDNKDYWTGTANEYAEMVIQAAMRVREADPNAVLVLGGMAKGPSDFLQSLIATHAIDRYVDVIAIHAYPESWGDERAEVPFQQWIPKVREMIARSHSGADLWLNEMGYADYRYSASKASVYGTHVFYSYEHSREYQASMLFKFFTMAAASGGVSLAGWYRIDDFPNTDRRLGSDLVNFHLGLLDAESQPKADAYALRFFRRLFGKAAQIAASAERPTNSQAVVNVFRTVDRRVIVTGWLRSSRMEEMETKTGTAIDRRVEITSAEVPCESPSLMGVYDAQGRPALNGARLKDRALEDIRLSGSQVFVAEIACGRAEPVRAVNK